MINVRNKGATGEREIADDLNYILKGIYLELKLPWPDKPIVQRNQNQSAVGGCDLTGTYGLAIEIKRQEQLTVNTWWAQCTRAAEALDHHPVLLFRQNAKPGQRTKWRCITIVDVPLPHAHLKPMQVRAEMDYEDFKNWFRDWAKAHIVDQYGPRIATLSVPVVPLPPVVTEQPEVAPTRSLFDVQ